MEIAAARERPSRRRFVELAHACGFELAGVAEALPLGEFAWYRDWVEDGFEGPMGYLADHRMAVRSDPRNLMGSARSVLCLGKLYNTEYNTEMDAPPRPADGAAYVAPAPGAGSVSRYAWGAVDYHDVLRASLETLAARLKEFWGNFDSRVCVDTAPLLERSYARAAGLGWIGRNTCLINEPHGSWFFLGEILVSVELPADSPPPNRCGSCTRCIDACPTQALVPRQGTDGAEWQLDARLCISTLTIEQKGATAEATRADTGYHLFGCDICQDVCPWNRRAPVSAEPAFQPQNACPNLDEMASMTRDEFRQQFRSTPVWRTKYEGWLRNVATAMGNSGDPRYREALRRLAAFSDAGVAEHASWALNRLSPAEPAVESQLTERE